MLFRIKKKHELWERAEGGGGGGSVGSASPPPTVGSVLDCFFEGLYDICKLKRKKIKS